MNKRIQELKDQCYIPIVDRDGDTEYDMEKFAQLIIKDYEKLLPEICPWVDADKEGLMYGWHVQFVARKHFGVEE